jgi:hypothetical protein
MRGQAARFSLSMKVLVVHWETVRQIQIVAAAAAIKQPLMSNSHNEVLVYSPKWKSRSPLNSEQNVKSDPQ